MVSTREEFLSALKEIRQGTQLEQNVDSPGLEKIASTAVFENGVLRGFDGKLLVENLTVSQFERFLKKISRRVEFGDPSAVPMQYNMKPNPLAPGSCQFEPNHFC